MAIYDIEDPTTGKSVTLEGDSPPTEQELNQIFSQVHGIQQQQQPIENKVMDIYNSIGKTAGNFLSPVVKPLMQAYQPYEESQRFSPQSLLGQVPSLLSQGAHKAGTYVAEDYAKNGMNPYAAAGIGTVISMGPDVAMAGINPMAEEAAASKAVPDSAVPIARRSMGFQKSMLKTPFARGQADKAAQVALENNVIPWSGNPETALSNATDLANKAGQKIGQTMSQTPVDLNQTFDNLEQLRGQITQGLSDQGTMAKAHSAIDSVQNDIMDLASQGRNVTADTLAKIKNRVGNSINYLADLASQSDNKAIVNTLGNTVRNFVKAVQSPEAYQEFLNNQRLFSSAKLMQKGLNNEVAGQSGNRMFSPYSVMGATGEVAAGNPVKAGLTLLGIEKGMRRGTGIMARGLTEARRAAPAIPSVIAQTGAAYNPPKSIFKKRQ